MEARPDAEVPPKVVRRRFSPGYKLEILDQADRCAEEGLGALLRKGLYHSNP